MAISMMLMLSSALKVVMACLSKTLALTYGTTWHQNPHHQHHNIKLACRECQGTFINYILAIQYVCLHFSQLAGRDLRRGRDHLMWVLLQFISGSIQRNPVSQFNPSMVRFFTKQLTLQCYVLAAYQARINMCLWSGISFRCYVCCVSTYSAV